MNPRLIACLLCIALPARAFANEVKLEETYWQHLAQVGWVDFDTDFNAVFHTEAGYTFAKTGKQVKYRDGKPEVVTFIDRAGRVWVKDTAKAGVHFWNGLQWDRYDAEPVQMFEDSSGRVFLFNGTHVHILNTDGKWTSTEVSKKRHNGKASFAEQGKTVWMWLWAGKEKETDYDLGVWNYNGEKWTHHNRKAGFPFHAVHCLYPVADGRVLLFEYRPAGHGISSPYFWHPERKLELKDTWLFPDKFQFQPREIAFGTDGTLFIGVYHTTNNLWMAVDTTGKLHDLPKRNLYSAQYPVTTINNRTVVFAKLGESPPLLPACAGDFLGADRDGRFYFNRFAAGWKGYSKGVSVNAVAPKREQPGQVCRVTQERTPIVRITKDDTGKIWGEPVAGGAVLQWNNGQWVDTPVQPLLRPRWIARPAPPWNKFQWNSNAIFRAHGKNGSLLVVRVRDIYQTEAVPEPKKKPPQLPLFPQPGTPLYHLEAHFYHNGKWSEPTPLREFVAKHAATLLADFTTSQGEMNFLAYANDGKRLWFAADEKVFTADERGTITEIAWPLPQLQRPLPPLSPVMLAKQPNGKVLFCANRNFARTLAFANGKVTTENATMPESATRWRLTRDESLWMWHADADNLRPQVWLFRENEWHEQKELGVPLMETADGELWFLPVLPDPKTLKLSVARGAKVREVAIAEAELPLGFDEVPASAILWVWGDRLFRLEPGEKPRVTWRILSEKRFGGGLVTTDAKGLMLFGHAHGLLKP